ncbi:DUF4249 domain-containing protein [Desertivirga xinjiangensis]|uniref:DUF4249 domain-containing protein n=1 Tax=Desertivirga xinjiangensis TaxID=539206 RepID=UPI0021090A93|nr:DUF4249 domain-containing protein [Pedobacter xinjiangensis]
MIHYFKYLFLSIGLIAFSSCEKVIDLNLDSQDPALVIEGTVGNLTSDQIVKISRSVSIGGKNEFPGVSGATVTVSDDQGRIYNYTEQSPGVYITRRLLGTPGRTYFLKVTFEGKEYRASSAMPFPVHIDSLGITSTTIFSDERKSLQLQYQDPAGVKNCYRFILTVNGVKSKTIFIYNDDFNDGNTVNRELFDTDIDMESGDNAGLEIQCIDPVLYRYWQGLDQNRNRGGASTTPANPVSNITNGALGYFSAHTQQMESVTIP